FDGRVGLFAAFFEAATFWQVSMGRVGLRRTALPFFALLAAFFLVRWLRRERPWRSAALCGVALGLLLYTYTPGRFFVFVLAIGWLWGMLRLPAQRQRLIAECFVFAAVALVVFAPLGWYFLYHPDDFTARAASLSVFNPEHGPPLEN